MRAWIALNLWGPVLASVAVLFGLSSRSSLPGTEWIWDKLAHVVAWTVLTGWTLRATHGGVTRLRPLPAFAAVGFALLYGVADEWYQAHVPGRHASVTDWYADAAGAGLALIIFALSSVMLRRRVSQSWTRAIDRASEGNG